MNLLAEMKRRKVFRVTVAYAVLAWLLIEVSDTVFPRLGLPEWTVTLVIALLLLGFPLAIFLAWAYDLTPDGIRRDAGGESSATAPGVAPAPDRGRRGVHAAVPYLGAVAVGALALGGLAFAFFGSGRGVGAGFAAGSLDASVVAVMPFRVNAPDELSYLGAGFMDLLAARLDGAVGPRAVDPGAVVAAMSRENGGASSVARKLGAGLVLTGSIVGGASGIVVSAELSNVSNGSLRASASSTNHPDSLTAMADGLVVQLLSLGAGEYTTSIATLTSTSPPAVRAYLRGKQAFRDGEYFDAIARFDEALALDSTFALAAIAREDGATNTLTGGTADGLARAWRHRERLGPRDLDYLEARLPQTPRTGAETIAIFERLTRAQPDRIEAWYWLGEHAFHARGVVHDEAWASRVRTIFEKVLELDPGYFPAVDHLIFLEPLLGAAEQLRAISVKLYDRPSQAFGTPWFRGIARGGDQLTLDIDSLRTTDTNGLTLASLWPILAPDQTPGDFVPYVDAAFGEARRRAGIDIPLARALDNEYVVNVAMGRPARAAAVREERIRHGFASRHGRATIYAAVWDGVALADAAAAVAGIYARIASAGEGTLSIDDARDLTAAEIWRNRHDPARADAAAAAGIRGAAGLATHPHNLELEGMALLIEAWAGVRAGDSRARASLDRLLAIITEDPGGGMASWLDLVFPRNLIAVAAIHEELGDITGALATLDREPWTARKEHISMLWRDRGRLAALAGDTDRALLEYGRWLKLHVDAEPSVAPQVEAVRAEVARLEGLHSVSTGRTR